MTRTVVLINGGRKRVYPVPGGAELQDAYTIDGERWTVVAVLTSEDVPAPNGALPLAVTLPVARSA
jgi:hypothetical protein